MRPTDELTMYAYGLLEPGEEAVVRAHVDACAGCAERVKRFRGEKRLLERAAGREPVHAEALRKAVDRATAPPRPGRRSLVPLALAAILLVGLAGVLLYRPARVDLPADAGRKVTADPIDRLIGELKSPNPLRREMAVLAITAYGQAAAANMQKAKVDPALFPGLRWRAQDPAVVQILRTRRQTLSFENDRADLLMEWIGRDLGLKVVMEPNDPAGWDPSKTITFKVKDLIAENSLKLVGSQFGLSVFAEDGKVVLSPQRPPGPPRAPIRIGNRSASAGALVLALESPSEDERRRAERELERLNFAAEGELWAALDSPIAHVRETAARLVRRLYEEGYTPTSSSAAVKAALREKKVTTDLDNAPLTAVVDYWAEARQIQIHIVGVANPEDVSISFKGENLTLFEALTLALEPHRLGFAVRDAVVVISPKDQLPVSRPGAPLWMTTTEASRIESLLGALGSRDPAARRKAELSFIDLGEWALAPLNEAVRVHDLPLSGQARALRDRILAEQKLWPLEAGSGAGIQELSDEQKRILDGRMTFSFKSTPRSEILETLAQTQGRKLLLRERPEGTVSLAVKELPMGSLLRAFTLPHGLAFYLDGETVVVDSAARVRAAVEK